MMPASLTDLTSTMAKLRKKEKFQEDRFPSLRRKVQGTVV